MDWIVNNIQLAWTCNSTVRFSKYVAILICLVRFVALGYN